jgi:hypothetical protein
MEDVTIVGKPFSGHRLCQKIRQAIALVESSLRDGAGDGGA